MPPGMSFSGTGRSKRKPLRVYNWQRLGVQLMEIAALLIFFVGIGLESLPIMLGAAAVGWGAVALAYNNFQKDMAKRSPERRDSLSVPKLAMYIAFTLAAALTLMALLTIVVA